MIVVLILGVAFLLASLNRIYALYSIYCKHGITAWSYEYEALRKVNEPSALEYIVVTFIQILFFACFGACCIVFYILKLNTV